MARRKRKATPAQLRALAKGRRTIAARRKNPAFGKFYTARAETRPGQGRYAKARAVARGVARPVTRRRNPPVRSRQRPDRGFVIVSFTPGSAGQVLTFWSGRDWGTRPTAARYASPENALPVAKKCNRYCAITRSNTSDSQIRSKMIS